MIKLGIISAFDGELKPLVEGWTALRLAADGIVVRTGRIGAAECFAAAAGMGSDAAARACAIAESAASGLDGLMSIGWAGALSCGVHPGRAYPVAQVVDSGTGERFTSSFRPSSGPPLTLVTLGHVAQSGEKRGLAGTHQAVLVDMEAAAVARMAASKGFEFYCFKAVSDAYDEVIPDFSRYSDKAGHLRMPALLAHLALRPGYWPAMARMSRNTKIGAAALAVALRKFLEEYADNTPQKQ